jgi:4-hydroxy-tetrahydrodipicolinate reductase
MLKLAITGAAGRMGQRFITLACEGKVFELCAALEYDQCPKLGQDAGLVAGVGALGVKIGADVEVKPDVMIDFSVPASTMVWAEYCRENVVPLVVGTTGLTDTEKAKLKTASGKAPVLIGANMSVGVNLLFNLVAQVAKALDDSYDIEIVESHHRFKRDAPSGTALELARRIIAAKDWPWPDSLTHGREGREALRQPKTVGMHAVRAGDIVGIHDVIFSTLGETITLHHTAHNRDTFVRGGLHAAQWLVDKKPGLYSMADVLGL